MKKVYLSFLLLGSGLLSQAQNININMQSNQGPVNAGTEGTFTLRLCHVGSAPDAVEPLRLAAVVTAPDIATITAVTNPNGSPLTDFSASITGGNATTGANNTVRLENTATLNLEGCLTALVRYRGLTAGENIFTGALLFINGPQTPGNNTGDDNTTVGVTVTGATPVSLSSFAAKAEGKNAELSWTTAQEKNNAFFEVQHSTNGRNFETVGQVEGKGTTSQKQTYGFTHFGLNASVIHYYRLRQVDFDGKFDYSVIKSVQLEGYQGIDLSASTLTSRNVRAVVNYGDEQLAKAAKVSLVDLSGRTLSSQQLNLEKGENPVEFQTSQLSSGLYLIRLENEAKSQAVKVALP